MLEALDDITLVGCTHSYAHAAAGAHPDHEANAAGHAHGAAHAHASSR